MKITIYELLGLIKDGKAPKKIKVYGDTFEKNEYADDITDIYVDEDGDTLFGEYNWNLDDVVIILDEEDEFIDIEEMTLNGEKLGYGGLSEWLGSKQTDNEVKLCSSIECLGVTLNDLIKNQKKIINKLKEEGK